ncbi:hypothetical protein Pcinc_028182 [Petrolisthes cinctipes]|uniref:Uncharacterized protein n=1 Tax=Petrolisthes cinctipes TaxID=88211 RepID=A0AAE1F3N6_PETCI|nr:hypothetical protein Pcinc_028182 [Petrolisthes cinctipes]
MEFPRTNLNVPTDSHKILTGSHKFPPQDVLINRYVFLPTYRALKETVEEKDLGVIITNDLKPSKAAASANSLLGLLSKTMTCLDSEMLLTLYKSLVRPRLEYCIQAWSPYTRGDIKKLEQVQRRATKLVPELAGYPDEERLTRVGLTTLEERRIRGDMIETFKILKGFAKVGNDDEDYLKLAPRHSLKLAKPCHRTIKRNKFFSSRIISKWNSH